MKSIRTKLTLLLFFIALIPLLIVIVFYLMNNIASSIANEKSDGILRNSIVNEHISEHFERSLAVLRTIARNPMTQQFVVSSPDSRDPLMAQTLSRTNDVFNDTDNMIVTDRKGDQVARTDTYPLINVEHRRYFHEAMQGEEYISDVLISLANNRMITVLEVPVFDEKNNVVGMVIMMGIVLMFMMMYRNPAVALMPAVAAALAGKTGSIDVVMSEDGSGKKERMLVCYSKNEISGWVVITEKSYKYIWQEVVIDALAAVVIGGIMLFVLALVSAFIAEKATRKIRAISSLVDRAAKGSEDSLSFSELEDDELGQMAVAINKIRSSRDSYRKDAEVDKLTGLLNKATFERLCRGKLSENRIGVFSTLIVVDLDHFKEVNDTLGHQAGDALLHSFGDVLRKLFRPTDLVGRFGGDEFVVLLNDIPGKEIAVQKAKRIVEAACETSTGSDTVRISASVGMASTPQHGVDYDSLFSVADKSVYSVKESGRNGLCHGTDPVVRI